MSQNDASAAAENQSKRLKAWKDVESAEVEREKKDVTGATKTRSLFWLFCSRFAHVWLTFCPGDASFLDDVQSKAFAEGGSLQDNLGRRAHYRQGKADALS